MIAPPKPVFVLQRSPLWSMVRDRFVRENPLCAACGRREQLEVHHVKPFYLFPQLELDPTNLVTLCEGTRNCHYTFGHAYNWRGYNPGVRTDVQQFRERVYHSIGIAGGEIDPVMPMPEAE